MLNLTPIKTALSQNKILNKELDEFDKCRIILQSDNDTYINMSLTELKDLIMINKKGRSGSFIINHGKYVDLTGIGE